MGRIWFSKVKSYFGSSRYYDVCMNSKRSGDHLHVRPIFGYLGQNYDTQTRILNPELGACARIHKPNNVLAFSSTTSNCQVLSSFSLTPMLGSLPYSSFTGNRGDKKGLEVPEQESSSIGNTDVGGTVGSSEWVDRLMDGWQSVVDAVGLTGQKAKEVSDQLTPYAEKVLDSHPYLNDVVVPVGSTVIAAILAWAVMPTFLKRLHKYSSRGSAALLSGGFAVEVPYEKSVWGALEDPVRYMMTFMAIYEICYLVAPQAGLCQLIGHSWNGALILSGIWFLQRWKTNVFARALADQNLPLLDRERLLALHRISSLGLFAIAVMAFAEASGVPIQSIVTLGGIGGVATAYAAKDILGNVISGLSMQYSKPFSLGDSIKAGSIEGQVIEMGLTCTSLLNAEKFPVIVPNSMISSQVIVNKSRAEWRAFVSRFPLQFHNLEKVPDISTDIKSMLDSYPKVFLGREPPYCYLSRIDNSYAELTLGCNLIHLSKTDRYSTEQDILLRCIHIIKQHGASLGSADKDLIS